MTPDIGQRPAKASKWIEAFKVARRIVAFTTLAFIAGVTVESNMTRHLKVCVDTLTNVSTRPVVHLCHPLGVTDAPVVLGVLMAAAFMLPDISKIKVAGLVELEHSVKESVKEQEKLTKDIERIVQVVSTRAEATTKNYYLRYDESIVADRNAFERKVRDFTAAAEAVGLNENE